MLTAAKAPSAFGPEGAFRVLGYEGGAVVYDSSPDTVHWWGRRSVVRDEGILYYAGGAAQWIDNSRKQTRKVGTTLEVADLDAYFDRSDSSDPEWELVTGTKVDREFAQTARDYGLARPANRWHRPS